MDFAGTYEHSLDAKNRLTVPAAFRSSFSDGVVVARGVEPCIELWRPQDHAEFARASLEGLNPLSPKARELRRFFHSYSFPTELDSAGRVMIPPVLLAHAGVKKECVVSGVGASLEVWDRQTWARYTNELVARVPDITASLAHTD